MRWFQVFFLCLLVMPAFTQATTYTESYHNSEDSARALCESSEQPTVNTCSTDPYNGFRLYNWCGTICKGASSRTGYCYSFSNKYTCTSKRIYSKEHIYNYPRSECDPGEDYIGPSGTGCITEQTSEEEALGVDETNTNVPCPTEDKNKGIYGNPCNAANGNKYQVETDIPVQKGMLSFSRHYNSNFYENVSLGYGWFSPYFKRLFVQKSLIPATITIKRGSGYSLKYVWNAVDSVWQGQTHSHWQLLETSDGYQLVHRDSRIESYDLAGLLMEETDTAGNTTLYGYSDGRLANIQGPFGHTLSFTYSRRLLESVTDSAGNIHTFTYDALENLVRVDNPDFSFRQYHYENAALPHHLTGITDERGVRYSRYDYDAEGRAILTEHAGGQERFTFSYDSDTQTTVTNAAGHQEVLTFQDPVRYTARLLTPPRGVKSLVRRENLAAGGMICLYHPDA